MRVINVVKIKNGVAEDIKSFGIIDEQLSQNIVEDAEDEFIATAEGIGLNDNNELEKSLENGYYAKPKEDGNPFYEPESVCITWSYIDNVQI